MTQQYPPAPQYGQPYGQQLPPKKRKVWPWVLLAVVLIPVLGLVSCVALLGAGAKAVDDARKGGTVQIGETFTYASGLAITVAAPEPYNADNQFVVDPAKEKGYESVVTVVNGTKNPLGASLLTMNVTVANRPAERIFTDGLPTQDIAPGQKLEIPLRFKVGQSVSGPLQISVQDTFNEPVFFTGMI